MTRDEQKDFLKQAVLAAFPVFLERSFAETREDGSGKKRGLSEDERIGSANAQSFMYAERLLVYYAKRMGVEVEPNLFSPTSSE